MNCNSVRTRLAGYLDDGLTGSNRLQERASVREHLESCADCREDLQRFRKLGAMLPTVRKHTPPPGPTSLCVSNCLPRNPGLVEVGVPARGKLVTAPKYCSTMFFVRSPCLPLADSCLPSWFSSWFFRSWPQASPCAL